MSGDEAEVGAFGPPRDRVQPADKSFGPGAGLGAQTVISPRRGQWADKPRLPVRVDLGPEGICQFAQLRRGAVPGVNQKHQPRARRTQSLRGSVQQLPQRSGEEVGALPGEVGIFSRGGEMLQGSRGKEPVEPVGVLALLPEITDPTEMHPGAAAAAGQGQRDPQESCPAEFRQRPFHLGAAALVAAAHEDQVARPVLELGEDLQAHGITGRLINVHHAEKLRAGRVGMAGEELAGFRALAVTVVHLVFDVGMRAADQPADALLLVNDPAFDLQFAELRAAGEQRIFQRAKERRIRQGFERHDGRLKGEGVRERIEVGGGISPAGLKQLAQLIGDHPRIEPGASLGSLPDLDGGPPDLDPMPARVQQFEADELGAERRTHEQGETRMRQSGIAAVRALDRLAGQSENPQMRDAIDDRADIRKHGPGLGQEPAADPDRLAGKDPRAGFFHVKDVGGVFVHGAERKLRRSPGPAQAYGRTTGPE